MAEAFPPPESPNSDSSVGADDYANYQEGDDIHIGMNVYIVREDISLGYFGKVFKCHSKSPPRLVALKVMKKRHTPTGNREIEMLKKIRDRNVVNCIRMLDYFFFEGQVCIAFELLGPSLRYCLNQVGHFSLKAVQEIARDLFTALCVLRELNIIHADIKPDNIILVSRKKPHMQTHPFHVKLIDFGAAHEVKDQSEHPYIQTAYYRAPEVILRLLPYDGGVDVWSAGCTIAELFAGRVLFQGTCEYDILRYIMEIVEPIANELIEQAQQKRAFMRERRPTTNNPRKWTMRSPDSYTRTEHFRKNESIKFDHLFYNERKSIPGGLKGLSLLHQDDSLDDEQRVVDDQRREMFMNFLKELLEMNPEERSTAPEVFARPFMQIDFNN